MLQRSDYPVAEALALLARHRIDATLLVPTATGLGKSIMDATEGLRDYLSESGYHDFKVQGQGQANKVTREVFFVRPQSLERSNGSFYRPETKSGDPRIWLGAATRRNAGALNLLALTIQNGDLYVLNMSDVAVRQSLADPASPFMRVAMAARVASPASGELLDMLRSVSAQGYIRTRRAGDTGVGMTLETMLGIQANSARAPDYKGIELKASRRRPAGLTNRSTLFSKVPSWKLSPVGSAAGLLQRRGYHGEDGRLQLYQTLSGSRVNARGLMLEVEAANHWLKQVHLDAETRAVTHDTTWELRVLEADLAAKHSETFWVRAACRGTGADEEFHYLEVHHTQKPLTRNLSALIEAGTITVDYLLHQTETRVRDHGYLFKIHPTNLPALFPPPEVHRL
jgi:hypothetical protein